MLIQKVVSRGSEKEWKPAEIIWAYGIVSFVSVHCHSHQRERPLIFVGI